MRYVILLLMEKARSGEMQIGRTMRLDQGVVSSVVFAPIIEQMGRNEDEKKESFQENLFGIFITPLAIRLRRRKNVLIGRYGMAVNRVSSFASRKMGFASMLINREEELYFITLYLPELEGFLNCNGIP